MHTLLLMLPLVIGAVANAPGSVLQGCTAASTRVICKCGEVDLNGLSTTTEGSWNGNIELTVEGCKDSELHISFDKGVFPYLYKLHLNEFSAIYFQESQIINSKLNQLIISSSTIKSLPMYSFRSLRSLENLGFLKTRFPTVQSSSFVSLNLKSLEFKESSFKEVKSNAFNVSVEEKMEISKCKIGKVRRGAFSLNLVGSISLCSDQTPLPKLTISQNIIDTIESDAFQASCVKEFELFENTIGTVNAKAFGLNIHNGKLEIEGNKITRVKEDAFLNITNSVRVDGSFGYNSFQIVERNGLITPIPIQIKRNLFDCCRPDSYEWLHDMDKLQNNLKEQRRLFWQTGICAADYYDEVFERLQKNLPLNTTYQGNPVRVYSLGDDDIPDCTPTDENYRDTGRADHTEMSICLNLSMIFLLYRVIS